MSKVKQLVNFLQDYTNLAEMLSDYGYCDDKTINNPDGDYAMIERWLTNNADIEDINDIIN